MRLYETWNPNGICEIVADSHVDEFEFFLAAKNSYGVEIEPGSIKQMWQTTKLGERKRHDSQVRFSYPVTIGKVKLCDR